MAPASLIPSSRIWPVLGFLVEHHLIGILRLVQLTLRGIDAELAEHAFHAEGARLIGHDGHHMLADHLVLHQRREDAHESHGGGNFAIAGASENGIEVLERRHRQSLGFHAPRRQVAAQRLAAFLEVLHFRAVFGRAIERHAGNLIVGDGDIETVAERLEGHIRHFLRLMGDVLAFTGRAHAIALHGLGQNHRWLAGVLGRRGIGRIHLERIVATAIEAPDVVIGHVGDHFQQLRIFTEEVLAHISAVLGLVILVIAVHALFHALEQQALGVLGQQGIPVTAPDHLDDIPAGTAEHAFEFLNDLAVAAHRAIQALQIAVHHENQVVELLAPGQGDRAQ